MTDIDPHRVERVGPYQVVRLHAEGGQAWIFEVHDPKFSVRRALKALKPQPGPAGEFERFRDEAQVLATISHPYLLTPYDFGRDDATGWFYYTMAFVEGETLAERLERGPLAVEELRSIFLPVLEGLCAVHEAGVTHRDIKPSNVLISNQGHAYLADLGIMIGSESVVKSDSGRTQTGLALGTARYMSPEQARGRREEIGPGSDVFSLGLVLYESLTGQGAYTDAELSSKSGAEILMYLGSRVFQEKDLELSMGGVARPMQLIVRKACRLRIEARYASAREMRDAFQEALRQAEGGRAPGAALSERLGALARRIGRRDAILLSAALLLVIGFFLGSNWRAEARAGVLLGRATDLDARAAPLLVRLQEELGELTEEVALAKRGATFELDAARAYRADGMPSEAGERAERAILLYEDLCSRMDWAVQKRATQQAGELRERLVAYDAALLPDAARASLAAPDRWQGLQGRLDTLVGTAEAEDACQAAEGRLEHLASAPEIATDVASLEQELEAGLQELAEELRTGARDARALAVRADVSHVVARERLAAGDELLAAGDARRVEMSWFAAVESYSRAQEHFAQVAALGPVLAVKLHFEAREREARSAGASGLRSASRVYDHAERLLLEGKLEDASQEYHRALDLLEDASPAEATPARG